MECYKLTRFYSQKSACCMTVRDCAPYLPKIFKNIDRLKELFTEFVLIVAYDNCVDHSEKLLNQYKEKSKFPVHLYKVENNSTQRTIRIATARNICLEKLESLDVKIHFMIDADDVNISSWNIQLIKHYLSRDDWDALTFNRRDYYDIWALMYPPFHHHCWGFSRYSRAVVEYMKKDITAKLEVCDEWIQCQSAFNGFAIYKTPLFKGIRYDGEYKNLRELIPEEARQKTLAALDELHLPLQIDHSFVQSCEHLYYHLKAIQEKNVRIYISRYFI